MNRQFLLLFSFVSVLRLASADSINYAIISSDMTLSNPSWVKVIDALSEKHKNCKIFSFKEGKPEQVLLELKESAPKYTCFVAHHKEVTREWVSKIHQLTRNLDEDPYTDTIWGILTGYDAANALSIAKTNKPLTIERVASGTEVALEH